MPYSNLRSFWDGRASSVFNAASPFGAADARGSVLVTSAARWHRRRCDSRGSSRASQGGGPAADRLEMSFDGRAWMDLGARMLTARRSRGRPSRPTTACSDHTAILAAPDLLPELSYDALIRTSFQSAYWSSPPPSSNRNGRVIVAAGAPTLSGEFTRCLHFGLFFAGPSSLQSELVSDDTSGGSASLLAGHGWSLDRVRSSRA